MSNNPNMFLGATASTSGASISSVLAPFCGGGGGGGEEVKGYTDTVRTLAATVGATSMVATLASPVPSKMLLTTSSSSSHSSNSIGTVNNYAHRFTTGGLPPSSTSPLASGVGTFTSSSTAVGHPPMDSHTQSNASNISNNSGSRNIKLSSTSGASSIAATDQPNGQLVGAPKEVLSTPEVDSLYNEGTTVVMDGAAKNGVEVTGSSSSTFDVHLKRNAPKHKLSGGEADEPPATKLRVSAVGEANNNSRAILTEMDVEELLSVANNDGGERLHNGPSRTIREDDAAITKMFAANNGVGGGQSPPAAPLERCKKIVL
uniref:Uncharacterized protein n=1 Tax=Anopheles atroparvus TaxID=41427 RepID=A0A182J8K6_ANOAO